MKRGKASARWWEIPRRTAVVRRREFEALAGLITQFERRGNPWQVGAAGFEARVQLREPGLGGAVVYKVHLVGWEDNRARCHASVTLWPRATVRTTSNRRRLASRSWCEACSVALAQYGYRGKWQRGELHLGDFWKQLKGLRALKAEIKRLEQWVVAPPWSERRRTIG